jgi:hypothetical protein
MSKKLSLKELKQLVEDFKKIHCPKLTAGKKALMEFATKHNLLAKGTVVEDEPKTVVHHAPEEHKPEEPKPKKVYKLKKKEEAPAPLNE